MDYFKQIDFCKPIEFSKQVQLVQCSNQRIPVIPVRGVSSVVPQNGYDKCHLMIPRKPPTPVDNFTSRLYSPASDRHDNDEPPPPYPRNAMVRTNYSPSIQNRRSPMSATSSGIYSALSAGSPSPVSVSTSISRSPNVYQIDSWQRKTHSPIIMQSVKSTQVQRPTLQTAIAPQVPTTFTTSPITALPSYASSIQSRGINRMTTNSPALSEPPSYASSMAVKNHLAMLTPPPYVSNNNRDISNSTEHIINNKNDLSKTPPLPPTSSSSVKTNKDVAATAMVPQSTMPSKKLNKQAAVTPPIVTDPAQSNKNALSSEECERIKHKSPIPERKVVPKDKKEGKEGRIKHYSPQAFKFFMEQHVENVIKAYKQRIFRKNQLEKEMGRINLSEEAQVQMRRMLNQKESNYIRLKRAKMKKSMFTKIKTIGVGAFGEVALVQKIGAPNLYYAMKTLKKADVLKRNQVAHVKAERDILAEADNEWVVKLFYSFQDRDNLYFVMDYIPGGDLMSLLIKMGIFTETLARFYIAELTVAVESVHKMGFIHRDIKPDNILIDNDGHIKLTDFGLCTGFRWTHDSKYYRKAGDHARQDSMEPWDDVSCVQSAVLERRRQREHQRCLAHSLVGTPNYIAPEVLARTGYTQLCDWWSVGVILYEMLVGQPPFLANTAVETQQKVINWEHSLHIPPEAELSQESSDLILRLCSSADRRLGKSADEVKSHAFFKSMNFGADLRQQKAPYIPKIEHPTDTSNFDEIDPERIQNSDPFDAFSNNTAISFHGFYGFTYRRFFTNDKSNQETTDQDGSVYV